jgi:hypothetical protein
VQIITDTDPVETLFVMPSPHRVGRVPSFFSSSELGLPQPLTRRRVCPPPFVPGGGAHWRERGWESPIPTRGHTDTEVLCIYMYFVPHLLCQASIQFCHLRLELFKVRGLTND